MSIFGSLFGWLGGGGDESSPGATAQTSGGQSPADQGENMNYVIIGAGPAGLIAAETLRKNNSNGSITMIGEEPEPPYARMAIPYFLAGEIGESGTHIRKTAGHYDALGIVHRQERVVGISPGNNTVALEGGGKVPYDRLLIATGASPIKPAIEGLDHPKVNSCWTLDDARKIVDQAKPGSKVVMLGVGFVACIIMPALLKRGVDLTVVSGPSGRMVRSMMTETAGGMIRRWYEKNGVKIVSSGQPKAIEDGTRVVLDNGETLEADQVIVAIGVNPNVGFLNGSGIETDYGILVDNNLQTNVPGIYAAGDVAQGPDCETGERAVHSIQPTAVDHGRIAALNMVGKSAAFSGSILMNVLDVGNLVTVSFGKWSGVDGGDHVEVVDEDNFKYLRLEFKGDCLVGACGVGMSENIGAIRGLIQSKVKLGEWKQKLMNDPHKVMDAYVSCTVT
jgi:NAD(P)H-nitrite reductase large subunit